MRKMEAWMENGKAKNSKQNRKHKKRNQKRPECGPMEKGQDEGRHNFYFLQTRYDKYTPLNAKRQTIIKEVYNARIIRLSPNATKQQVPLEQTEVNSVSSTEIMAILQKTTSF